MFDEIASAYRRIRVDGQYLSDLYPGWATSAFVSLSDNIHAIVFREENSGQQAVWFLNSRYDYCGSHIEFLTGLETDDVLDTVGYAFKQFYKSSLSGKPAAIRISDEISEMPEFLALHLSLAWSARHIENISVCAIGDVKAHVESLGDIETIPEASAITKLLTSRVSIGSLIVQSPFTEAPLKSQLSFLIEGLLVHRFFDASAKSAFYLIWSRSNLRGTPSLYLPKSGLVVSDLDFSALLPAKILAWYLRNPDHVQTVEYYARLEEETFNLGHTSDLIKEDVTLEDALPLSETRQQADLISPAWAFLNKAPTTEAETQASTSKVDAVQSPKARPRDSLFGRWFQKSS